MNEVASRGPARVDLLQSLTGLLLVLFIWGHMFFESSILLEGRAGLRQWRPSFPRTPALRIFEFRGHSRALLSHEHAVAGVRLVDVTQLRRGAVPLEYECPHQRGTTGQLMLTWLTRT